jgi:glycosyltransferase involved in cell wall biosynthesis
MAFGGGAFSAAESRLIRRLRLDQDTVRQFSGGDNVLCELYANASAFVYPSLYEGFGFPPLEAMSHGCPVVSSNTSSMPEVIGHAAKFFDPTSTEDIKEAIEAVVYSDQLRLALIETGNRQFKQFSWRKCAAKTLSLYEKVSEQFQ